MAERLVRAHYPSGTVEERFTTEADARAADMWPGSATRR